MTATQQPSTKQITLHGRAVKEGRRWQVAATINRVHCHVSADSRSRLRARLRECAALSEDQITAALD